MMPQRLPTLIAATLLMVACVPQYVLVSPRTVTVAGGSLQVTPTTAWNRVPTQATNVPEQEVWTRNGPLLDRIAFFGGIADGKPVAKQPTAAEKKVPLFRADTLLQDLPILIESHYRIIQGAQVFQTTAVKPVTFLGQSGVQLDYQFVAADEIRRKGRATMTIREKKLYAVTVDGTALTYFDKVLPEYEAMIASAVVAGPSSTRQ